MIPACLECYFTKEQFWWVGIVVIIVQHKVTSEMVVESRKKLDGSPLLISLVYALGLQCYGFKGLLYAPTLVALAGFGMRMYNSQKNLELVGSLFSKNAKK